MNNYTIQQANNTSFTQICPDTNFVAQIDTVGENDLINIADSINSSPNLRLQIGLSGSLQSNSALTVFASVANTSPYKTLPTMFTLNYDTTLSFVSVFPTPDISQSGSFTWNIDTLKGFKNFGVSLNLQIPQTDTIGTLHCFSGNIIPASNETDSTDNNRSSCFIVRPPLTSYDPNNIMVEPKGFDPAGFITNTEDLTYTVQFQNTGNAPATYVEIIDTLPSSLNFISIEPLLASHYFTIQLLYPNVLKFVFNNIVLPDSSADEIHSHGLIRFKVKQLPNNLSGTVISNSANIIFDANSPVQTNIVTNTIFDCNQMASVSFNNSPSICKKDTLIGNASLLFPMQTLWIVNSGFVSSGLTLSIDTLSAGNHIIEMIASNSTCSQSIIQNIFVDEPVKPTFNVNGNLLTSSSTTNNHWYFNGDTIAGANQNTYTIQQSGWYMLSVIDSLGCSAFSDSTYISPLGIQQLTASQFSIYPDLITEGLFYISYSFPGNANNKLEISDINGKKVHSQTLQQQNTRQKIILSNLSNGLYAVRILSGHFSATKKIIVLQ